MILNMTGQGGSNPLLITETYDTNGGIIYSIDIHKAPLKLQAKTVTPTSAIQTINPDTGYDGFSQVIVNAGGIDGNNLEYGLTDGTLPIVGVALVGSAEI